MLFAVITSLTHPSINQFFETQYQSIINPAQQYPMQSHQGQLLQLHGTITLSNKTQWTAILSIDSWQHQSTVSFNSIASHRQQTHRSAPIIDFSATVGGIYWCCCRQKSNNIVTDLCCWCYYWYRDCAIWSTTKQLSKNLQRELSVNVGQVSRSRFRCHQLKTLRYIRSSELKERMKFIKINEIDQHKNL